MTYEDFVAMALELPGSEAGSAYGTPAVRVRGKFLARLREPDVLVLTKVDEMEKEMLIETRPEAFFITDHYRGHPTVLVRLSRVDPETVRDLLHRSWRQLASRRQLAQYDASA